MVQARGSICALALAEAASRAVNVFGSLEVSSAGRFKDNGCSRASGVAWLPTQGRHQSLYFVGINTGMTAPHLAQLLALVMLLC